jgi:hypothetical protein
MVSNDESEGSEQSSDLSDVETVIGEAVGFTLRRESSNSTSLKDLKGRSVLFRYDARTV